MATMKLKNKQTNNKQKHLLLGRKAVTNLDSIFKSRGIILLQKPYRQSNDFFSIHVWMWELDHKEGCVLKNWCFQIVVLEKTLESPLDCKNIKPVNSNQSILKEINPEYSLERQMLKLKLQYIGQLMWRDNSLGKTLMLGRIEGRRRREPQKMKWLDSITDSVDIILIILWEIVKERWTWHTVVHGVAKSWTQLATELQQQRQHFEYPFLVLFALFSFF